MTNAKGPQPQPGIAELHLYSPGAPAKAPEVPLRKLSSNENLYGPSPDAIAAIDAAKGELWRYPSVDHLALRQAIGDVHELNMAQIVCGAGSDELLSLLAHAYAGQGDEVIITSHGFEVYGLVARAAGADIVIADEVERLVNVDNIIKAVTARTKIIFVANPGNPSGTWIPIDEIARLLAAISPEILLVLDGAYAEFTPGYDGGAALVDHHPNLVMTRTFSKLYGLGGLRIGWAYAQMPIIDVLNKVRGPFNLSTLALEGARASMRDQEYALDCRDKILAARSYLTDALRQMGLQLDESHANFVLARFKDQESAEAAHVFLYERGLLVRKVGHYGLPEALRLTIGTMQDCQNLASALHEFMEAHNGKVF